MDAPTAIEIRSWSQVDFEDRGFATAIPEVPEIPEVPPDPPDEPGSPAVPAVPAVPDELDRLIEFSTFWLEDVTGRVLPDIDVDVDPLPRETARLAAKLRMAIMMLVEHRTAAASEDQSETAGDIAMIDSFGAGSYNEKRRTGRMIYRFHPWRELDDLLWDIATDAQKAKYGGGVPEVGVPKRDWDVAADIMNAQRNQLGPFGPIYYTQLGGSGTP